MDKIKKGLGRGLSSLIGETKVEVQKNQLPISDLIPNKFRTKKLKKTGLSGFFSASLELTKEGIISIVQKKNFEKLLVREKNEK